MGFRFSRRISLFKGLRLNLSKSGTSVSVRGRGGWLTFGKKGTRATVGLPGTGMSWSEKIEDPAPEGEQHSIIFRLFGLIGISFALFFVGLFAYVFVVSFFYR